MNFVFWEEEEEEEVKENIGILEKQNSLFPAHGYLAGNSLFVRWHVP